MKIMDAKRFQYNLEYLEDLKRAEGPINESIICLVDYSRNINSLVNFLSRKFTNFGLEVTSLDESNIINHFTENDINYYTVKAYIITKLEELKETK